MTYDLILLRHGHSEWNAENLFTGWYDCPLNSKGRSEARKVAPMLQSARLLPEVVHTSRLDRAIETAEIVLRDLERSWVDVRRSWRLNERHYGNLTGLNKAAAKVQYGARQLQKWRRGYLTPPPPIREDNEFNPNKSPAYRGLPPDLMPRSECLADVLDRILPYWYDSLVPDLKARRKVLVVAHGNSLRALVKHLDDISDEDITHLNIGTGIPINYVLDSDMTPLETLPPLERAVDPAAAKAAAAEVAAQADIPTEHQDGGC
ncbi:MAG: 2,3-bisphosphoglycerate-dependent phosphoglycerate mutase [Acidimicrobiaceae bacterium]|nr:2,3-bisphosphoglycerate-dependent phosphoglycerate mutase [Acidimicrobiaceae bacterium]